MVLYHKIVSLTDLEDLELLHNMVGFPEELYKYLSVRFVKAEDVIVALKYLAYAYDKDSVIREGHQDRLEQKFMAAKRAGMDMRSANTNDIVLNCDLEFNKAIGAYGKATQSSLYRALLVGEDVLEEMFSMLRDGVSWKSSNLQYGDWVKAVKDKGDTFLKSAEVAASIKEIKDQIRNEDRGMSETLQEETQTIITPEMMVRRRKDKEKLTQMLENT